MEQSVCVSFERIRLAFRKLRESAGRFQRVYAGRKRSASAGDVFQFVDVRGVYVAVLHGDADYHRLRHRDIPNGEYVSNVQIFEADETHEGPYLVFTFSGSTEPKEISLPRGKDGVGIDNIEFLTSDNDGYAGTLKITLSDGTIKDIPIPAATGISGITRSENDESYELTINYTDGTSETFDFSKPNQWLSGASTPDFSLGRDGDFYFNTNKKVIYKKVNSEWITVMEFVNEQKHRVVFEAEGAMLAKNNVWVGDTVEFEIVHGCYMTEHVPVPRKNADADKYKFIGWYRKKQAEISEGEEYTLSRFTDLTPVCDDIVLYAWWEKIV